MKPLSSEAAAKIKIEKDSKPEAMDRLDRRLIQLKIEREAVRKEKDEASVKRFDLIEEEILKLQRELNDLDSIWKAEKAAAQGSEDLLAERVRVHGVRPATDLSTAWKQATRLEVAIATC